MPILTVLLYVAIFIVALLLIVLILIQPAKSGGMGAAFGGIGESVFGGKAGSHLTKTTVVMTTIFFVIALVLAAVIGLGRRGEGDAVKQLAAAKAVQQSAEQSKKDDADKAGLSAAPAENKPAEAPAAADKK